MPSQESEPHALSVSFYNLMNGHLQLDGDIDQPSRGCGSAEGYAIKGESLESVQQ